MKKALAASFFLLLPLFLSAGPKEDYTIDRRQVYEFTQKPAITKQGDRVTIRFASKDFCDATVVIENEDGTIIRHLASGVLGSNAPKPFQKNSLKQTVVWEGKNDLGRYVDVLKDVRVRVSLGLRAQFEKDVNWHPKRRIGLRKMPRITAQPEGVYVYEGAGCEYIRMFDHSGKYVRTVCPFPSGKVEEVKGLPWYSYPDGHRSPKTRGYWRSSYMLGGEGRTDTAWATTADSFDVRNGRIATVSAWGLCRLNTDGRCGPHPIYGPKVKTPYPPQSIAISPDGKVLYLTGCYMAINRGQLGTHLARVRFTHGVYRMAYGGKKPAKLWLGNARKSGNTASLFDHPSSVCVDKQGRVYIADNHNNRVQIFSKEGKIVKSLPVSGPAVVRVCRKTGNLYVFSWTMALAFGYTAPPHKVKAMLRGFRPFESNKPFLSVPLPLKRYAGMSRGYMSSPHYDECPYRAEIDTYADPPVVWMNTAWRRGGPTRDSAIKGYGLSLFRLKNGTLVQMEDWNAQVRKAVTTWKPTRLMRKRMYVDPSSGMLYVAEDQPKATHLLTRINPDTLKTDIIKLPYTAEEFAIDTQGHIYLRCAQIIGRHRLDTLREVPFDYGEERSFRWSSFANRGRLISGLLLPGGKPCWWHESGMSINPRGELAVFCHNEPKVRKGRMAKADVPLHGRKFKPQMYPGRKRYGEIHVWDKHGTMIRTDVVQGILDGHGTYIDQIGNIYFLAGANRLYTDGKKENSFLPLSGCIMKFKPNKGKLYATRRAPIPLSDNIDTEQLPKLRGYGTDYYVRGAEWIYPGIGYVHPGAPCQCWNCRFTIDTFGRVFAPETYRSQIAVLDTNGNLMMHIGTYGNVDDGVPLVKDMRFRTRNPRSVGGDEVALAYANYTAVFTDHRLFIYDAANDRILSVKLDYHKTEFVPLEQK